MSRRKENNEMTNGDRIRQMTDEELIKMLEQHHSHCTLCSYQRLFSQPDCEDCFAKWLQQDAEDE